MATRVERSGSSVRRRRAWHRRVAETDGCGRVHAIVRDSCVGIRGCGRSERVSRSPSLGGDRFGNRVPVKPMLSVETSQERSTWSVEGWRPGSAARRALLSRRPRHHERWPLSVAASSRAASQALAEWSGRS